MEKRFIIIISIICAVALLFDGFMYNQAIYPNYGGESERKYFYEEEAAPDNIHEVTVLAIRDNAYFDIYGLHWKKIYGSIICKNNGTDEYESVFEIPLSQYSSLDNIECQLEWTEAGAVISFDKGNKKYSSYVLEWDKMKMFRPEETETET